MRLIIREYLTQAYSQASWYWLLAHAQNYSRNVHGIKAIKIMLKIINLPVGWSSSGGRTPYVPCAVYISTVIIHPPPHLDPVDDTMMTIHTDTESLNGLTLSGNTKCNTTVCYHCWSKNSHSLRAIFNFFSFSTISSSAPYIACQGWWDFHVEKAAPIPTWVPLSRALARTSLFSPSVNPNWSNKAPHCQIIQRPELDDIALFLEIALAKLFLPAANLASAINDCFLSGVAPSVWVVCVCVCAWVWCVWVCVGVKVWRDTLVSTSHQHDRWVD